MLALTVVLALATTVSAYPKSQLPAHLRTPKIDSNARIVGGEDAETGAYPFMASVRGSANNHICGGSIVNTRAILTAAHCISGASPPDILIVAGTNTLDQGGVSVGAQTLIIHADYDFFNMKSDIGVILLQSPLIFSNLIAPVILNTAETGIISATVVGWGTTGSDTVVSNNLQQLLTQTTTQSRCRIFWASLTDDHICTENTYGEGVCFGDSGTPLIETSSQAQIGLVEVAVPCASGFPEVYTRVSSFVSWINEAADS